MTLKLVAYASRALEWFYTTVGNALDDAHWAALSSDDREAAREYPDG